MRRRCTSTWLTLLTGLLIASWVVSGCRNEADETAAKPPEIGEQSTRFDDMTEEAPKRRVSKAMRRAALERARRVVDGMLDRSLTLATGVVLGEDPSSMEGALTWGKPVGIATRDDLDVTLRLRDEQGPIFAEFRAPRLETQPCWSTLWQPDWLPVASAGSGVGLEAQAQFVWWRFDVEDGPPYLVRFGPDGIALWRPGPKRECYRGESLLGLVGGALRTEDYLSPVAPTDGASPDETEATDGDKPLRIDILPPRGKEILTARGGAVELRTAKKRLIRRWKTSLPRAGVACSQAAYHRFEGDPARLFFEVEFSDDDACDEGWGRREVQQTLFELRDGELVQFLSGGMTTGGDDEGEVESTVDLDVKIDSGDGYLHYVGGGKSERNEFGGAEDFDCSPWAADQGFDAADTGYSHAQYKGRWTFETEDTVEEVGPVGADANAYVCSEAPDGR